MKLKLIDFIKEHTDWEALLSQAPYCLNISRDQMFGRNLIMFKYNQIDSDFSNDIVKECRGIILDEAIFEPVSVPYFKFFNTGEPNAANVDWYTAVVTEKIDGSLMKVVKLSDGNLLISTNGCIDAFKCNLPDSIRNTEDIKTFGELFMKAIKLYAEKMDIHEDLAEEWFKSFLSVGKTYMFELCSPFTRIVIPHTEIKLYFHGWRDNTTLNEIPFVECDLISAFPIPKIYSLKSLDDCIAATQVMPWNEEGYVVVDKNFNRVKIKSPAYLLMHRLANNGNMSSKRAVELWIEGDYEEVLAYFPEYRPTFDKIQQSFDDTVSKIEQLYHDLMIIDLHNRKDQASWIFKNAEKKYSSVLFHLLDHDCKAQDRLKEIAKTRLDSFIGIIGFKV